VGDVQARDLDARNGARELIEQEPLPAAHIQNAVAGLQPVVLGHSLRHVEPAPVIVVAPVTRVPAAVPVFKAELLGHLRKFGLVAGRYPREVVALRAAVQLLNKVNVGHGDRPTAQLQPSDFLTAAATSFSSG